MIKQVRAMINKSKLQPIREIRQNELLTEDLEQQIVDLIFETTLDKGPYTVFKSRAYSCLRRRDISQIL